MIKKIIERETDLMRKLKHPNIIEYIEDYPTQNGERHCIVMELAQGKNSILVKYTSLGGTLSAQI